MPSWRARAGAIVLIVAASLAAVTASAQPAPTVPPPEAAALSQRARDVLAAARASVVQIRGFFGGNTAQAFHGTGFSVAPGGLLVTNYHVVAEPLQYPDKYRLEYRSPDGRSGKVSVLAIDVRHDLALVRAEGYDGPPLQLDTVVPAKGERAYSIGFPLDVGLTITEGVSNGQIEDSFAARIHYSGAINGGMSGGPAVNAGGTVIGVNVSGYRFQQLVSFLVPAAHVAPLLRRALEQPLALADARREVGAQLRAHSRDLLAALDGPVPAQIAAGYALPGRLAPFIDCSAAGDPAPDQPVQGTRIECAAKAGLYVRQGVHSGDLTYAHYILVSERLDPWRFAHRLSKLTHASGQHGRLRDVGPFACRSRPVELAGFSARLMVCVRAHRHYEGLYDITAMVASTNAPRRGFASHVDLLGVEFEAGMGFVRRYLEAMKWQP